MTHGESSAPRRDRLKLVVTRHMHASPERVFDAFLDPEKAGKFMFATADGEMVRVEIDARVGGKFAFVDRRGGTEVEHKGEYLELQRPNRLVFTFAVDGSEATTVSVDIARAGGGCDVTLTHEMSAEWADYADRTKDGWATILAGLEKALA